MHSVPVPINVRCNSNSDIIVRRSEVTLRADNGLMHCNKNVAETFAGIGVLIHRKKESKTSSHQLRLK
jgi:hypothetical protein